MFLGRICRNLFRVHEEIISTHDALQKIGRKYICDRHINYFLTNRDFYSKACSLPVFGRVAHFPKIIKDRIFLFSIQKHLFINKKNLGVYTILEKSHGPYWMSPTVEM